MTRTYDAQSMVVLPNVDAGSGSALVAEVVQVAKKEEKNLPARVGGALDYLVKAEASLAIELSKALSVPPAGGTVAGPEREEAVAWTACEQWLAGTKSMPSDSDKPAIAARLYAALFGEGVQFVRGAAHKRWSEIQRRIDLIHAKNLAADFAALGGKEMLATLEAKHRATGLALGFTTALPPVEVPQIRTRFDDVKAALRQYVLQVAASVDSDKPATAALCSRLLYPIASYEPPARNKAPKVPVVSQPTAGASSTASAASGPGASTTTPA